MSREYPTGGKADRLAAFPALSIGASEEAQVTMSKEEKRQLLVSTQAQNVRLQTKCFELQQEVERLKCANRDAIVHSQNVASLLYEAIQKRNAADKENEDIRRQLQHHEANS